LQLRISRIFSGIRPLCVWNIDVNIARQILRNSRFMKSIFKSHDSFNGIHLSDYRVNQELGVALGLDDVFHNLNSHVNACSDPVWMTQIFGVPAVSLATRTRPWRGSSE
jgi:hypothetical protein